MAGLFRLWVRPTAQITIVHGAPPRDTSIAFGRQFRGGVRVPKGIKA